MKIIKLLLFLILIFGAFVAAQATEVIPIKQEQEQQFLVNNSGFSDTNLRRTHLLVRFGPRSSHNEDGETFNATVYVENIGDYPARSLRVSLVWIPDGWKVVPGDDYLKIGDLDPGRRILKDFTITRDDENAEIYALVEGDNVEPTSSYPIKVPVFPIVLFLMFMGMVISYFIFREN